MHVRNALLWLVASTFAVAGCAAETGDGDPGADEDHNGGDTVASAETLSNCEHLSNGGSVPSGFYAELRAVREKMDPSIPASYVTGTNAEDMARIACRESTYHVHEHASGSSYYGRYQMSEGLVRGMHVSWTCYWDGCRGISASHWQTLAALRYVRERYGSPSNAWAHEVHYNWY